ncbi:unnamed protein product [Prunus armeniaca]|uniref:Uncharacterized protein n=1 Tax=Prunus armeniaca TaxID=36596 RepID=A0A6J5VMY7_PRUAR|nr:unnamed protein product [Prunus armeniaca]
MSQGDVVKHGGVEGTKLACRKAIWLGTGCQRRHKACMSQDDVARHGVPMATQSLHVASLGSLGFGEACGPFTRPLPFGKEHRPSLTVVRGSSSIGHRVCSITLAERQGWLGSLFGGILCSFDLGPWSISKSEGREAQRQLHVGFVVSLFQCLTAKTSESFREKIFHGSYRSARLKVVGAFGIGKSRLWQQKVSARVVTALARGLLRFSKVKKWRFQPSVASAV